MSVKNNISLVIPVYNEAKHLTQLNEKIVNELKKITSKYQIIYVDDGSNDRSLELIKKFSNLNNNIYYISFTKNFGQHAAIMAGFSIVTGEYVFTIDSDLQNPPEELSKLYNNLINSNYDIVTGVRSKRKDNFYRKFSSYLMNKVISYITKVKLKDYGCMMRVYKLEIIKLLLKYGEKSVYIPAYSSWITNKILEVNIEHNSRYQTKSKYSFFKLINQVFDLITAYTLLPIRAISFIGITIFFAGIFLFLYLMYYRIILGTNDPLTSFVAILLLVSGITILSLGIISEYMLRIYKEVRAMPTYIIKDSNITK